VKWSIVIASHTGKIVQPTKSIILGPGYKAYPENEGGVKLKKKKNEEGVVVDLFWSRIAWKSTFVPGHIIVAVNGTIPILCTDSLDCSSDADIWRRTVSHALSRTNFCAIAHTLHLVYRRPDRGRILHSYSYLQTGRCLFFQAILTEIDFPL
jgi:hypothetical protein